MDYKGRGHPSQSEKPVTLYKKEEKVFRNISTNILCSTTLKCLEQVKVKRDNTKEPLYSLT